MIEQKEEEVFKYIANVLDECKIIFLSQEGKAIIPTRIQFIILFSLLDVFANYDFEYKNQTGTQKERFKAWVKNYCFVQNNKEYNYSEIWQSVNEDYLYNLRSSLVHFFGMREEYNGTLIALGKPDKKWGEITEKMENNDNVRLLFLSPYNLSKLVGFAAELMINTWGLDYSKDQNKFQIDGINRIYKKLQAEGCFSGKL